MEIVLQALLTTLLIFGPAGLAMFYANSIARKKARLVYDEVDKVDKALSFAIGELEENKKHLAHAISELQILKGGMIENDELIDNLFEREKLMVQELEDLRKPKKIKKSVSKALKPAASKPSSRIIHPKSMVFNMTNTKSARRAK